MRTFQENLDQLIQSFNESPVVGGFYIQLVTGFFNPEHWVSALNEFRRLMKSGKYRAAYNRLNRVADFHAKRMKTIIEKGQGHPVACGHTGCDQCCRVLRCVSSRLEASVIRGCFHRLTDEQKEYVVDRARQEEKLLLEAAQALGHTSSINSESRNDLAEFYASMGGRCVFLGRDGGCLIYNDRPWICRLTLIFGPKCTPNQTRRAPIHHGLVPFLNSVAQNSGYDDKSFVEIVRAMTKIVAVP